MRLDDFVRCVAGEAEKTVKMTVWTMPDETLADAIPPGGIGLSDFVALPGRRAEERERRYRHILGHPASKQVVEEWERSHPSNRLPTDLRELVSRVNGIHLWADDSGRAYEGLAPIEEWDFASAVFGSGANEGLLDGRYVAISYHADNAAFVVLDCASGTYYLMDVSGPNTSAPIARRCTARSRAQHSERTGPHIGCGNTQRLLASVTIA